MEQTAKTSIIEELSLEKEVAHKALAIPDQAIKAIKVVDKETMSRADAMQKVIADIIKEIDGVFKPMADKAFQAHRAVTGKWNEIKAPLIEADKALKGEVKTYLRAEQERAEAEQRRLAEIARKEEEERRLREAEALERAGNIEEAAAVIEEPIYVAPVTVEREIIKVDNRKYRTIFKARVIDKTAFIIHVADMLKKGQALMKAGERAQAGVYLEYADALDIKEGWINKKAASQEKNLSIPGLQAYEEK
jgi:tetratricopeptide (TPR) repeat protein